MNGDALTRSKIGGVIADVLHPRHFFVASPYQLAVQEVDETIRWELLRGRLLPPAHTRQERTFHSWHVLIFESETKPHGPVLSCKLDSETGELHIVRGLLCYVWEGFVGAGNVAEAREVTRWVFEWVGAINLREFSTETELRQELAIRLYHAVVGVSRLPLTSIEAPLPGFSFGQFGYFCQPDDSRNEPVRTPGELLGRLYSIDRSPHEQAKLLELALRACSGGDDIIALIDAIKNTDRGRDAKGWIELLHVLLNDVSLSPYTHFVDNLRQFVSRLVGHDVLQLEDRIDFLAYILRQLGRHLTAYDLMLFHNRGANYPDALLLEAILTDYVQLIEDHPEYFTGPERDKESSRKRLRRRALRQGWLLFRSYEGLPVPDAPTSPGENMRVLPTPFARVPEEQIIHSHKRRVQLFHGSNLRQILEAPGTGLQTTLAQAIDDLQHPLELCELGMAVFIDRPLGYAKAPGEPDQTILFSHEAFSRNIGRRRLDLLRSHFPAAGPIADHLEKIPLRGIPAQTYTEQFGRVVSLADANRSTNDFLFLRTTASSLREFNQLYAPNNLNGPVDLNMLLKNCVLILLTNRSTDSGMSILIAYDKLYHRRLELAIDATNGYRSRGGHEYPAGGLLVVRSWQPGGPDEWVEHDWSHADVRLGLWQDDNGRDRL